MISYQTFSLLPQEDQAKVLWMKGVCLELVRHTPFLMVELYALYQFYVEIFFDKNSGEPLFLKPFNHTHGLDLYLGEVQTPYLPVSNGDSFNFNGPSKKMDEPEFHQG